MCVFLSKLQQGVDSWVLGKPGVIAAAALKCMGGSIQGRLWPRNDDERDRAIKAGYKLDQVLPFERGGVKREIMLAFYCLYICAPPAPRGLFSALDLFLSLPSPRLPPSRGWAFQRFLRSDCW
jgi:Bacterial fructose-1,6-bisphosphatase, glpX-encoded